MNSELIWITRPVSSLTCEEESEISGFIDRANSAEFAPFYKIFPGRRMRVTSLVNDYAGQSILLIRDETRLAGTATLGHLEDHVTVSLLAVAPEYRGRGLGAAMIDRAQSFAKMQNLKGVQLDAIRIGRLIDFYLSLGFCEVRTVTHTPGTWGATQEFDLVTLVRPNP